MLIYNPWKERQTSCCENCLNKSILSQFMVLLKQTVRNCPNLLSFSVAVVVARANNGDTFDTS